MGEDIVSSSQKYEAVYFCKRILFNEQNGRKCYNQGVEDERGHWHSNTFYYARFKYVGSGEGSYDWWKDDSFTYYYRS